MEDVIVPEKLVEWDQLSSKHYTDIFTANATDNFSPEPAVMFTRNRIRESQVSSKKGSDVQKCCVSVAKDNVVLITRLTSTSLVAKDSKKEHWKSVVMEYQRQNIAES